MALVMRDDFFEYWDYEPLSTTIYIIINWHYSSDVFNIIVLYIPEEYGKKVLNFIYMLSSWSYFVLARIDGNIKLSISPKL